jgi:hypothetical protein
MIKTDKYIRIKSGEASFELVERFSAIKIDFTKVKKEKNGTRVENSPSKVQGSSTEETREVPGSQKESR